MARTTTINALRLFRIPVEEEVRVTYRIRDSLYLNITNRCTNACTFCPKRHDYRVKGHLLKLPGEPTAAEALAEVGDPTKFDEIVFCGFGEPLLRLDEVKEIAAELEAARGAGAGQHGRAGKSRPRPERPAGARGAGGRPLRFPERAGRADVRPDLPEPVREASFAALLDFLREAPKHVPSVTATAVALPGLDSRRSAGSPSRSPASRSDFEPTTMSGDAQHPPTQATEGSAVGDTLP